MALLPDAVLDIDLLRLVAGERHIHARQRAVFHGLLPFELIQEVVGRRPVAEEQPVTPRRPARAALLQKSAERRNAGPRPDHDDILVGGGQPEMPVGAQLDANLVATPASFRDIGRCDALAIATMGAIAHRRDQEMRLVADIATRRRDGIGARRQRPGDRPQMIGRDGDRIERQEIDQLPVFDPCLRLTAVDQ